MVVAQRVASELWSELSRKSDRDFISPAYAVAEAHQRDGRDALSGALVRAGIDEQGSTWRVEVTATEAGKAPGIARKGSGWIARDEVGIKHYGNHSARREDEALVEASLDELEALWSEPGTTRAELEAGALQVDRELSRQLDYASMELKYRFSDWDEEEGTVFAEALITPNTAEEGRLLRRAGGTLAERLKEIEAGSHPSLLRRFASSDWASSFGLALRTAQSDIAEARRIDRVYEVERQRYLFVPIPAGEVPGLIADRVHAAGRDAPSLQGEFGASEVVSFCRTDAELGRLDADWSSGVDRALSLLVQQGRLKEVAQGRYAFDLGFPLPTPGMHRVAETEVVPEGKRESHHAPAETLAKAWSAELRRIVDELSPSANEGVKALEVVEAYRDVVLGRAGSFDAVQGSSNKLSALLVHETTHRGTPDSIHGANSRDSTEAILARLGEDALVIYRRGEAILASNPQLTHWEEYIGACYERVAQGELREG
ncbi:MAG: hypothetical protein D6746_16080, partial [Bacteroidetes bacterium]